MMLSIYVVVCLVAFVDSGLAVQLAFQHATLEKVATHHNTVTDATGGLGVPPSPALGRESTHIAMLISGQLKRFVYKDALSFVPGGLAGLACGADEAAWIGCKTKIDVYITLSDGNTSFYEGTFASPPYVSRPFQPARIRNYFLKKGASRVQVSIVPGDEFEQNIVDVDRTAMEEGAAGSNLSREEWWTNVTNTPHFKDRYHSNNRMLFLRHLVYNAAVTAERQLPYKYSHILYTREDNVFIHPVYTLSVLASVVQGVVVDSHCSYGAHSDKIYFASRRGADVLFAPTLQEHVRHTVMWLNRGLQRDTCVHDEHAPVCGHMSNDSRKVYLRDPLQSEGYLKWLLESNDIRVDRMDFDRTEVRYFDVSKLRPDLRAPITCVEPHYYRCTKTPGLIHSVCPEDSLLADLANQTQTNESEAFLRIWTAH